MAQQVDDLAKYSSKPVAQPSSAVLSSRTTEIEAAFPHVQPLLKSLSSLGAAVVWASRRDDQSVGDIGLILIRFGGGFEGRFGLTREVLLIVSPHPDLQSRLFQSVPRLMQVLSRDCTRHLVLIATPDSREAIKLDDWSNDQLMAIPCGSIIGDPSVAARELLVRMRTRVYTRNTYEMTSPVESEAFFGRKIQVQELVDSVTERRPSAILGLRKSGKTSLLKEVGATVERDHGWLYELRDLESLPAPPGDTIRELILDIAQDVTMRLNAAGVTPLPIADLSSNPSVSEFRRAMKAQLGNLGGYKGLAIALDEIEYLCPPHLIGEPHPESQDITQFFGSLRSLVQETSNFTFLMAGLSPALVEEGMLYGLHNPLFSWATAKYVEPFDVSESVDMLRGLGARMGISWETNAVGMAVQKSGGHVFLLRRLGATVANSIGLDHDTRTVTVRDVQAAQRQWALETQHLMQAAIDHLQRYYPKEDKVLRRIAGEGASGTVVSRAATSKMFRNLINLGLLEQVGPERYRAVEFVRGVLG